MMYSGMLFKQVEAGDGTLAQLHATNLSGVAFITLKSHPGNSQRVWITKAGDADPANNGWPLEPGEQMGPIPHDGLKDLYAQCDGGPSQMVCIFAMGNGVS